MKTLLSLLLTVSLCTGATVSSKGIPEGMGEVNHTGEDNYIAGYNGGASYNDFFVFNLGTLPAISTASLSLYQRGDAGGGYLSTNPAETYAFFDIEPELSALNTTEANSLENPGSHTGLAGTTLNTATLMAADAADELMSIGDSSGSPYSDGNSMAAMFVYSGAAMSLALVLMLGLLMRRRT